MPTLDSIKGQGSEKIESYTQKVIKLICLTLQWKKIKCKMHVYYIWWA